MTTQPNNAPDVPSTHSSFRWLRNQHIQSLNLEVQAFEHKKTGALHYHLAADNPENVFLVALRTIPTDSSGVAHILEHTALCGSEKYPVRDPFFMMLRRSLNTFMNAFTSSDWTAYPFASQNQKDFYNLLDVYLDAVFFSRLDPLDFAQEGHRIEFAESGNTESDLIYKGVVFNEMKGAMSSPVSVLWQTLSKYLYPTTTYHFNSGGEPDDIPDLTYEQLLSFYKTHYHPSNAVFMTYGDIPAVELQQRIHESALVRFDALDRQICVTDEKRYHAPVLVEEKYATDEGGEGKTHLVLGWLLGQSIDLQKQLEAHLLSNVLLNDSASPLRKALETTDIGSAPSPLCGLEDSNREMCFVCGLEGSDADKAKEFEQLVETVLLEVAEKGVAQDRVEAVLHQLELSQREIRGDGYPYGLQLILSGLPTAVHRGDPISILNLDPVLANLHEKIKDPAYLKSLVKELLLDNRHRVRLSLVPDTELSHRKQMAEAKRLAKIKANLTDKDKQRIIEQSEALAERQVREDSADILPKVGISDVPAKMKIPQPEKLMEIAGQPLTYYAQGTNGLVYQQVVYELPQLDQELQDLIPYYSTCLTELGCGDLDYLQVQEWQSSVSGGIHAHAQIRGAIDDEQSARGYFTLSAKALTRNHSGLSALVYKTLQEARFDELERIQDIIAQKRAQAEQSVTGSGHLLAMTAACSGMSPVAALNHRLSGLAGIKSLKTLDESFKDETNRVENIQSVADKMQQIHQQMTGSAKQFLLIGESDARESLLPELEQVWANDETSRLPAGTLALPFVRKQVHQLWTTSTQVNFCAKAYPTVPTEHPDAVALTVLGEYLKNGYLHRAIREKGGAYGSSANQDSAIAAFRFSSYRDPRLQETLDDMDAALEWLLNEKHHSRLLEEAILGVISSIDKPGSPAGEAKQAFHNSLFGRTPEQRAAFRQRILDVKHEDLLRVGSTYLLPEKASVAVITSVEQIGGIKDQDRYQLFKL
ncbi:MAG: insulinase family protein [Pseudomonadales bacterium]|nr:insulinase family protein [Pseudomonadales bacterium]